MSDLTSKLIARRLDHGDPDDLYRDAYNEIITLMCEDARKSNELFHTKNQVIVNRKEADDLKAENERLRAENDSAKEIVKAVSHTGVDWGYGKYEIEDKFIAMARDLYEAYTEPQNPTLTPPQPEGE